MWRNSIRPLIHRDDKARLDGALEDATTRRAVENYHRTSGIRTRSIRGGTAATDAYEGAEILAEPGVRPGSTAPTASHLPPALVDTSQVPRQPLCLQGSSYKFRRWLVLSDSGQAPGARNRFDPSVAGFFLPTRLSGRFEKAASC